MGTSVAVEMAGSLDVENVHLETLVAFQALEVENVEDRAEVDELTAAVIAEINAVAVAVYVGEGPERAQWVPLAEMHLYSLFWTQFI